MDDLLNELAFSRAPAAPQSNDVLAADLLPFMAGIDEAADPVPRLNGSEGLKRKGASSSSRAKPKPKSSRNRALKEEVLDDDAELPRAIGGEEGPSTPEVVVGPEAETPPAPTTVPSPPPPPVILPEANEILSTGRVRKKTKTPYATATEQLVYLDASIPLLRSSHGNRPAKARRRQSGIWHAIVRSIQSKADMLNRAAGPNEPRPEDVPPPAVSTSSTPRPVMFRKPQPPRIPTLEEATPASPSLPQISELVTQSDIGPQSCENNADSDSPDPLVLAIDDEELLLKIGLAALRGEHDTSSVWREVPSPAIEANESQLRIHRTGAARSEGYYKIPEAFKSTYLPQRNRAMVLAEPNAARANAEAAGLVPAATAASASSRSNRINTRRLVQGMEQANKAMGDTQSTQLQFNQLRARKKQLIFARSPIHDWGLYVMEAIPQGEMIIDHVGEVIRAQVADKREKWYEKKKIVIYAKTGKEPGEEITYDKNTFAATSLAIKLTGN
ncbi:histone methyltransferase set1 [Tulasnella sp. 425]|nr:histone methyltransferase set1 [Tulasnella sp. 425]